MIRSPKVRNVREDGDGRVDGRDGSDGERIEGVEGRFWEVDLLRGVAIMMMVAFHALYDLDYFGLCDVEVHSGFWPFFARATATLFLLLVGVSLSLSFSRSNMSANMSANMRGDARFPRYLRRGFTIFCLGLAITLATRISIGEGFVIFGVLHLIGVSIVLAYPLLRFRVLNFFLGSAIVSLGIFLQGFSFDFPWLLWLGFVPRNFYTVDYFPILPWFGVVLLGAFFGRSLYPDHARGFSVPDLTSHRPMRGLCLLGRNSLAIYLVHQPLLVAAICLFGVVEIQDVFGACR